MKAIRIDISGKFGHFRMPYSMNPFFTYPFPTKTSIIGLAGALMGLKRSEYYSLFENSSVAVVVRSKIVKKMFGIKYIREKGIGDYLKYGIIESSSPRNIELLLNPKFAIFLSPASKFKGIENKTYTPSLGKSEFLADVSVESIELDKADADFSDSIVPLSKAIPRVERGVEIVKAPAEIGMDREIKKWEKLAYRADVGRIKLKRRTQVMTDGELNVILF